MSTHQYRVSAGAALLFLALLLIATPASARHPHQRADSGRRGLIKALESARRCHFRALLLGPDSRCSVKPPPRRYAELYEDVLALAFGANAPPAAPLSEWRMYRQWRCQIAIDRAVTRRVIDELRPRRRHSRSRKRARRAKLRRMAGIERHCDVEVLASRRGVVLPSVGEQCHAAVGAPGSHIDVPSLTRCLDTLVATWIERTMPSRPARRPNIVVILADDQRYDAIDATHSPQAGSEVPAMPAVMDRLANEGISFSNAFVNTPICGPSRASFFTGLYAVNHEVLRNVGTGSWAPFGGNNFDDSTTIATWLQEAGYYTGFFGKYINGYSMRWDPAVEAPYVPPGWDVFSAFNASFSVDHEIFSMVENGDIVEYGRGEAAYSTDVLADQAFEFIAQAARSDRPFLAYVSTAAPHFPWTPAPRHVGSFAAAANWQPANFFESDVSDKPRWVQNLAPLTWLKGLAARSLRQEQLAMGLSIDELVGRLLDQLDELGIGDDTVVIYTSDNGQGWGEHRWLSKGCAWEECSRVPLIVRYPKLAPMPRVEQSMVVNVDLATTLAEFAGIPQPPGLDGRSFVRNLDATARDARSDFLLESHPASALAHVGVRSSDWKYVFYYRTFEEELYDLANDPAELHNLADDPAHAARLSEMSTLLNERWPGGANWPF